MPETIQQHAFVLHRRPYRESSALVTFFSQENGKFNGIVRSVRTGKKNNKLALLQPFQRLELVWQKTHKSSESDLIAIRQIDSGDLRFPLQQTANICGLYANELLYRLLYSQHEVPSIYRAYQHLLYELLKVQQFSGEPYQQGLQIALRQFEYQLLCELQPGFDLAAIQGQSGEAILTEQGYYYQPEMGWQFAPDKHDRFTDGEFNKVSGRCLVALQQGHIPADCLAALKRFMRQNLAILLGNKPLNTRKLFT